jgi:hypothetical protein
MWKCNIINPTNSYTKMLRYFSNNDDDGGATIMLYSNLIT